MRLVFDLEDTSVPYDLDAHTEKWIRGDGDATPLTGQSGPARLFAAADAYRGKAASEGKLDGIEAITARLLFKPTWTASSTETLLSRGDVAGATAGEYLAWSLEWVVNAGATAATLRWAWEDAAGILRTNAGASVTRANGDPWILLAATREADGADQLCRYYADGAELGTSTTTASVIGPQLSSPVIVGARLNGAGYDRFLSGAVELVEAVQEATCALAERHRWLAIVGLYDSMRAAVQAYVPEGVAIGESNYDKYRVRPLARMLADLEAGTMAIGEAGLPPSAYGPYLREWEAALALSPQGTLADRQQAAAAALAQRPGFGRIYALESADAAFRAEGSDILEQSNDITADLSFVGLADSPWLVDGITATWDGAALLLQPTTPAAAFPWPQGLRAEVGSDHIGRTYALATIEASVPGFEADIFGDEYIGFGVRSGNEAVIACMGIDGADYVLGLVRAHADGTFETLQELARDTAITSYDVAFLCEGSDPWTVRHREAGTSAWTDTAVGASIKLDDYPQWAGFYMASAVAVDIRIEVSGLRILSPDRADTFAIYAQNDDPRRGLGAAANLMERSTRATAKVFPTVDRVCLCDEADSGCDRTPMQPIDRPDYLPRNIFEAEDVFRYERSPSSLYLFDEPTDLTDRIGAVDLTRISAPSMLQVGPGLARHVAYADGATDAHRAAAASSFDLAAGGSIAVFATLAFDTFTGAPDVLGKEAGGVYWRVQATGLTLALEVSDGTLTASTDLTFGEAGFGLLVYQTFAFVIEYTDTDEYTLAIATAAASGTPATITTATGMSNAGLFAFGAFVATAMPTLARFALILEGDEVEGLSDTAELQRLCALFDSRSLL